MEKWIEDAKIRGKNDNYIQYHLEHWVRKCDGLTRKQMGKKGFLTVRDWEIEVKVKNKNERN